MQTYSLAGPTPYTQKELADYVFNQIGDAPMTASVPKWFGLMTAKAAELLPAPWMTADMVRISRP